MHVPHPQATSFQFAKETRERLNTPSGLETACIEISQVLSPRTQAIDVADSLDWLACRVRSRQKTQDPQALLAHLHRVFFDEESFQGNLESYYVIENQLISSVLTRRQGMPVILSLVYKRIADRLGLRVEGLNTPGHFLIRVHDEYGWMVVDPFCGGRIMSEAEAVQRLVKATGWDAASIRRHCQPVQPIDWLRRCLLSLQTGLRRSGQSERRELVDDALKRIERLNET